MTPLSRTERRLLVMWLVVAFIVWNGVWDIIFDIGVRGYLLETALAYAKMGQGVDVHVAMHRTLFDALWKSTGWALLVLTAPRMSIPPELEADCVVLDWPSGNELDVGALFEEVRAEIQASTNRPVRLDAASRAALLDRVREMPAGRARFEIARALLAAGKHEP